MLQPKVHGTLYTRYTINQRILHGGLGRVVRCRPGTIIMEPSHHSRSRGEAPRRRCLADSQHHRSRAGSRAAVAAGDVCKLALHGLSPSTEATSAETRKVDPCLAAFGGGLLEARPAVPGDPLTRRRQVELSAAGEQSDHFASLRDALCAALSDASTP